MTLNECLGCIEDRSAEDERNWPLVGSERLWQSMGHGQLLSARMPPETSLAISEPEDPGRKIVRGAQAIAGGLLLRLAARLVFLLVAARLYGAHAYGIFIFSAALVELAVSLGSLATKRTLFPLLDRATETGTRRSGHVVIDAALLVTGASLALSALLSLGAWMVAPPAVATVIVMLAPMIAGQAMLDLFLAAARWQGRVREEVISRSLIEPWSLASGSIGAFLLGFDSIGLAAGYWCGTLAALGYAAMAATYHDRGSWASYRPHRKWLRAILRRAGANSANDFLDALFTRADVYVVGLLLGPVPTGIYGMARQVATPIRQVRQSFDSLLVPAVSKTIGHSGASGTTEALAGAARLMLIIQLPLLIAILAAGRPLLAWMGPGFEAGYWALVILAFAEVLQSAFGVGDLIFVYLKPRIGFFLTLASVFIALVAALVLIPALGVTGAAFSLLCAYGLRSVLRSGILHSHFGVRAPRAHFTGPLFAAAAASCVVLFIANPVLATVLSIGVYAAVITVWLKATNQRLALTGFKPTASRGL